MLHFRALGYMLIQMYDSSVSQKKSYHHISQLSYKMQDGSEVQTHFPSLHQRVCLIFYIKATVYFPIPSTNQTIQRNKISLGRRQTDSQRQYMIKQKQTEHMCRTQWLSMYEQTSQIKPLKAFFLFGHNNFVIHINKTIVFEHFFFSPFQYKFLK